MTTSCQSAPSPVLSAVSLGFLHPLPCPFLTTAQTSAHDHLPSPNALLLQAPAFKQLLSRPSLPTLGLLHPPGYHWLQFADCEPDLFWPGELGHSPRGTNKNRSLVLESQIPQLGRVLGIIYWISSTEVDENRYHQTLLPSRLLRAIPSVMPLSRYPNKKPDIVVCA